MDPRLWAAFFLHDVGYIGKEDLDGAEGDTHPELGGRIMAALFGESWGEFTKLHSRFFASLEGRPPSALCAADKLATTIVPKRLYLALIHLSGEVDKYLAHFREAFAGDLSAKHLIVDALPRLKPVGFGGDVLSHCDTSLLRGFTGVSRPETATRL
jgi:hypothetical protein